MSSQAASILLGTAGLTVAALVALSLSTSRGMPAAVVAPVQRLTLLGVVIHGGHFAEEYVTGFYRRFPELLGLVSWPASFFVGFNVAWMTIWLCCIPALRRFPRAAGLPVWFLAIASAANGVVHPLLALATGGYFPGLWTSPLTGLLGLVLLRTLLAGPERRGATPTT